MRNGVWGTICNQGWDLADANVACRQLGFVKAISAITDLQFGQGKITTFFIVYTVFYAANKLQMRATIVRVYANRYIG